MLELVVNVSVALIVAAGATAVWGLILHRGIDRAILAQYSEGDGRRGRSPSAREDDALRSASSSAALHPAIVHDDLTCMEQGIYKEDGLFKTVLCTLNLEHPYQHRAIVRHDCCRVLVVRWRDMEQGNATEEWFVNLDLAIKNGMEVAHPEHLH